MKKEKKQKKRLSLDWSLLASAGIFFILGRYIAPRYEQQFSDAGFDEIVPVSNYSMWAAAMFLVLFVLLWVFRIFRTKE